MLNTASNFPLYGLALTGGRSRRMGEDKGAIVYDGRPQVVSALALLDAECHKSFASINKDQKSLPPYDDLPSIVDEFADRGPAEGLLSAWQHFPNVAWLVLAVDMPRVTASILKLLVQERDSSRLATALKHADGTFEPLCAIWEPAARTAVQAEVERGSASLRRVLETCGTQSVRLPEPERLVSVNTPEELSSWSSARESN